MLQGSLRHSLREALTSMSQATRHELKLMLHEDIKTIVNTVDEEARAPKGLNGAAMPTNPTECLESVDALSLKTEAQVAALQVQVATLQACIAQLHDVRFSVERMVNNTAAARALSDAAFTDPPPPTAKEEAKRAAKRPKK